MISIGPFSIQTLGVLAALTLAWITARVIAGRLPDVSRKSAGALLFDAVFWGVIAARLAYVIQWWEEYSAAPTSMLIISDGGFSWWAGVLAALSFAWWRTRSTPTLRPSVLAGILTGLVAWYSAGAMVGQLQSPPMPNLALTTLNEQSISLKEYEGRPTVVNLWATWCPPCRREMPVFEQAQAEFPNVAIVLINQGESLQEIQDFLESEGLSLADVLLDPFSSAMQEIGARALPTTLFFNAQGRLVDSHIGEVTMARFKNAMARHFSQSAQSTEAAAIGSHLEPTAPLPTPVSTSTDKE